MQEFSEPAEHSVNRAQMTGIVILSFVVLSALVIFPSALFYFLAPVETVSSLAPGTIVVCILAIGLMAIGAIRPIPAARLANYLSLAVAIAAAIVVHFVGSVLVIGGAEMSRTLFSLPVLMLMFGGAMALSALLDQSAPVLETVLALLRWILVVVAVLAILGINPLPGAWDKPVFPFSEPSHLALVLNPLLMHACVSQRGLRRNLWLVGGILLAYVAESLTLMIGMMVAALICLPMTGLVAGAALAVVAVPFIELGYFTDRLDFGASTQNLSSLIYRQGWELAGDALSRTSGWGVGFQQLGYAPFRSPSADVVYSILKSDTNTQDGGFLLAKTVAEFGIAGAVLIAGYVLVAARATLATRRVAQGKLPDLPSNVVFALCVVCSFSVDVFVRGVGYFASSVLLFLASLYTLWEYRTLTAVRGPAPLQA